MERVCYPRQWFCQCSVYGRTLFSLGILRMQASTGVFVSAIAAGKGIRERVFIFGCCFWHIWRKLRHGSAAIVRQNLDIAEPWLFHKSPRFLFLLRVTAIGTKGVISCHITLGFWGSAAPKSLESVVSSFANNYITAFNCLHASPMACRHSSIMRPLSYLTKLSTTV